jgi:hypothetical protein
MKNNCKIALAFLFASLTFWACKTNQLSQKSGNEYRNDNDDRTLSATKSPFIMPYNRILDAAGESVEFGDGTFENHSLDAVKLADNKTWSPKPKRAKSELGSLWVYTLSSYAALANFN